MNLKVQKLLAMGSREIGFRVGRRVAQSWERAAYRSGRYHWDERQWALRLCRNSPKRSLNRDLSSWWLEHMRTRNEPCFLLAPTDLSAATKLFPSLFANRLRQVVEQGNQVCIGHFAFLGIDFVARDPISWQSDPISGNQWPSIFHGDMKIPFCEGHEQFSHQGDSKHVWELNRHEFLIDCAKAFNLTNDSRFAKRVFDLIESWTQSNPYLQGVNWAGPLEVAVRSLSWIWSYQFCRRWEGIDAGAHLCLIKSFYQHGAYLYRHLEFYTSPNNHLIGEATALYLLGCFFPEFDESRKWRRRGWQVLERQIGNQFYVDGGSTEQATFYHNYCLGFYLLALLTRQKRAESVCAAMFRRLERALEFTMWMTQPDGTVPRIGDADNARSIRFENPSLWDFRNLICLGAIIFDRSDMKAVATSFSEDALWLLGPASHKDFEALGGTTPGQRSRAFEQSGYYIMRSGWETDSHFLCFDCGPIAAGLDAGKTPSSAHGHSDLLSVNLSAYGKPLIVDGGFYTYNGHASWHRYFRETSAHNTISVDATSHARFHRSNAWSHVAIPEPIRWESTGSASRVECAHSGFFGVRPKVRHQRTIEWNRESTWTIRDRLDGQGDHLIEAYFHFAPGTATMADNADGVVYETDSIQARLECLSESGLTPEIVDGGNGPDGGWIGVGYGIRQRAPIVRFRGTITIPVEFCFQLCVSRALRPLVANEDATSLPAHLT